MLVAMMNYSEHAALHFLSTTRALVSDPAFTVPDWSATVFILSLAVLAFLCTLMASD